MERRCLGEGRFLRLVDAEGWEYTERKNASGVVAIVALTDAGELILVEQYRHALGQPVFELPAGLAGDHEGMESESFEDAARRELLEETGFSAEAIELLLETPSSSGLCSERVHIYRASGLTRTGPGGGDESEEIKVHLLPLAELVSRLRDHARAGALIDSKIFAALYLLGPGALPGHGA